jgi:hypothetical protein
MTAHGSNSMTISQQRPDNRFNNNKAVQFPGQLTGDLRVWTTAMDLPVSHAFTPSGRAAGIMQALQITTQ